MIYNQKDSGNRIRNLRLQASMTQQQLADAIGISVSNLSRIERGNQGMPLDLLVIVAHQFNTSLDYLVLGQTKDHKTAQNQIQVIRTLLYDLEKML